MSETLASIRDHNSTRRGPRGFALTLVAAALLLAAPLAADDSRWYVTASAGQSGVDREFGPATNRWLVDEEDTLANFEVGYAFHRNLGIQAGYRDLGSYSGHPAPCPPDTVCPLSSTLSLPLIVPSHPQTVEFSGVSLVAVPRWPVSDRLDVYGKVGVLDWRTRFYGDDFGRPEEPSGLDALGGLGAQYSVSKAFGVLVEYEASELVDAVSVGASWKF